MQHHDVAIIGGGIAGLSLASFLAPHRSVAVLEREAANGYHSTGRSAAEFTLRDNAPPVNALARVSHAFMAEPPEGFATVPLLTPRGSLWIGTTGKEDAVERARLAAEDAGVAVVPLTIEEAVRRVPFLDPAYLGAAYFDPDYWDIDVDQLLQGYARSARRAGAVLLSGAELLNARHDGRRWSLETSAGAITADLVVNAAGGWADTVAALCGVKPAGIVPHRRTAVTVELPAGIDAGALPEINEIDDTYYFKPDAGRLLVSPADETPCEPADVQPEELDVAYAAHYLEEATTLTVGRIASSWAGLRSFAADRLPVIGPARDNATFFWLAGQGGFGILTSPAIGQLAAGLIAGLPLPDAFAQEGIDPAVFSPRRLD
ncbi:NAD(P)/FAD-dependent oxidoreductase [Rhizobium sp. GN54]|uniref:NAD(P)/FAD-dependent oxidoreductase n=1 Tax=Rhizobium sp. GN54 TaxID=2898150 RepID=UPI001E2E878F|nr:FAD-binding oxidoreductase [Rhizobium sp. GN54]MCD2181299.1 FAD-binding oxidoreductase [Rhizobium sp. GN54]